MTQAEKLEALVRKAFDNRWRDGQLEPIVDPIIEIGRPIRLWQIAATDLIPIDLGVSAIIFDHDFAKALFGEQPVPVQVGSSVILDPLKPGWMGRLQEAVIADDPIDYMYEAVFGG